MRVNVSTEELNDRINLNAERLLDPYYAIDDVFDGDDVDWPGDKEGRALLAFVSHYKINGNKIPCMEAMIDRIPEETNGKSFFGALSGDVLFEQQLSGHSWYLRGLCEYYEQFGDKRALEYLDKTIEGLYLPTKGRYAGYPIERDKNNDGGVSGNSALELNGWKLSTDIACAFMSIDGLSHYYKITENQQVKELLDEMAEVFDKIDKVDLQAQTHCSLTAGRGFMRMYDCTGEQSWLEKAKRIFDLYTEYGMTYTYQNFNWFGKGDTWTEPCAIVDSLMLAGMLYNATKDEKYRTLAARIYFNGFVTMQRPNGGAGTDTTISDTTDTLRADMYEARFCCTMRYAEGLWYITENKEMLYAEVAGEIAKDEKGRYCDGDIIYVEVAPEFERFAGEVKVVDGHRLVPLVPLYKTENEEVCKAIRQRVIFK